MPFNYFEINNVMQRNPVDVATKVKYAETYEYLTKKEERVEKREDRKEERKRKREERKNKQD